MTQPTDIENLERIANTFLERANEKLDEGLGSSFFEAITPEELEKYWSYRSLYATPLERIQLAEVYAAVSLRTNPPISSSFATLVPREDRTGEIREALNHNQAPTFSRYMI